MESLSANSYQRRNIDHICLHTGAFLEGSVPPLFLLFPAHLSRFIHLLCQGVTSCICLPVSFASKTCYLSKNLVYLYIMSNLLTFQGWLEKVYIISLLLSVKCMCPLNHIRKSSKMMHKIFTCLPIYLYLKCIWGS